MKHAVKFVLGDLIGIGPMTSELFVKRVIGTPGQTVACCSASGALQIDGVDVDESYLFEDLPLEAGVLDCSTEPRSLRCFEPVTVPEGMLLMLGDHRSMSSDGISQCRGLASESTGAESRVRWVRESDVLGEPFLRFWPLSSFGTFS